MSLRTIVFMRMSDSVVKDGITSQQFTNFRRRSHPRRRRSQLFKRLSLLASLTVKWVQAQSSYNRLRGIKRGREREREEIGWKNAKIFRVAPFHAHAMMMSVYRSWKHVWIVSIAIWWHRISQILGLMRFWSVQCVFFCRGEDVGFFHMTCFWRF